jgi:hypothetical protein
MTTTQKPWTIVDGVNDTRGFIAIRGPNGEKIAHIFPFAGVGGVGIKEARANAALIVALVNKAQDQ